VAFYPDDRAVVVIKEPRPSVDSPMVQALKGLDFVRGRIVISHVRYASVGDQVYRNTHPFVREVWGREWVFAHNGTLHGLPEPQFYKPVGETDSEHAFCLLMDQVRKLGPDPDDELLRRTLEETALEISKHGQFNFLMSDGRTLYAFCSSIEGLVYTIRAPPHKRRVELVDKGEDEDFDTIYLSSEKGEDEIAAVVATRRLTRGEPWYPLPDRILVAFRNGFPALTALEQEVLRFIRQSPHRVSIEAIARGLDADVSAVTAAVDRLYRLCLINQDSRDPVPHKHAKATYYTNRDLRPAIDFVLNQFGRSSLWD